MSCGHTSLVHDCTGLHFPDVARLTCRMDLTVRSSEEQLTASRKELHVQKQLFTRQLKDEVIIQRAHRHGSAAVISKQALPSMRPLAPPGFVDFIVLCASCGSGMLHRRRGGKGRSGAKTWTDSPQAPVHPAQKIHSAHEGVKPFHVLRRGRSGRAPRRGRRACRRRWTSTSCSATQASRARSCCASPSATSRQELHESWRLTMFCTLHCTK